MYRVRGSGRIRIILTYLAAHCIFHTCLRSLSCIVRSLLCIHMLTCGGRLEAVTVQHQLTYCNQVWRALSSVSLEQNENLLTAILRVLLSFLPCNMEGLQCIHLFPTLLATSYDGMPATTRNTTATSPNNNAMHTYVWKAAGSPTGLRSREPQHPNSQLAASPNKDMLS